MLGILEKGVWKRKDVLALVLGLLAVLQFRVLGTWSCAEIIMLAMFPFIRPMECLKNKQIKFLVIFCFLWLIGSILSNIINNIVHEDFLKGSGSIALWIINIIFAYWLLYDRYKRIMLWGLGFGISSIIALYIFPTISMKSRLGYDSESVSSAYTVYFFLPLIVVIISFLYFKGRFYLSIILLEGYALWSLFNDSRNIFLTLSASCAILLCIGKVNNINFKHKYYLYKKRFALIVVFLFFSLICIKSMYEYMASQGMLGEYAQWKYNYQKYESGNLGLMSGRVDFLVSLDCILEHPLVGFGSFRKDENSRFIERFRLRHDVPIGFLNEEDTVIPTHSHILGAWVSSGILSIPFWIYSLYIVLLVLRKHIFTDPKFAAYIVISIITYMWDWLFSPIGARVSESMMLVFLILMINHSRQNNVKNFLK